MKIWVATTDQQQFTAYCLDMSRHYPPTISNTGEQSLYVKDSDMLLGLFVQTLKAGDTAANGSAPNTSACFGDLMAVHGDITSFRFLSTTVVDQTMLDAFNNDERVQFEINGATFADGYELTRDRWALDLRLLAQERGADGQFRHHRLAKRAPYTIKCFGLSSTAIPLSL